MDLVVGKNGPWWARTVAQEARRTASVAYVLGGRLRGDGLGLWFVVEAAQHLRRGDEPAQPVTCRLEDGVGVVLVGASHGQAPAQQLHGEGLWAGVVG